MGNVAVLDYGLGNLYSIANACRQVGLQAQITGQASELLKADALILPGVGAFGDAMATLQRLDLVEAVRDFAATGRPLWGICLGIQLLLSESWEFGHHKGLDLIPGEVVPFPTQQMKVPHVGWNSVNAAAPWQGTGMHGAISGELFYFVHSYVVQPSSPQCVLGTTTYGDATFCAVLQQGNIFACQFHPERSGPGGLKIYHNLACALGQRIRLGLQKNDA